MNYIEFETPLGVLAGLMQRTSRLVCPFLYIVRYTCLINIKYTYFHAILLFNMCFFGVGGGGY